MRVAVIGVLRTLTGFNVHLFLDVGVPLSLGKLKKERDALLDRVNVELRKHNDKPLPLDYQPLIWQRCVANR
jgi:hypothetical protein